MQKQKPALLNRLREKVAASSRALFARGELRSTLIAAALAGAAPAANAVDMTSLGAATDLICLISSYVSGAWLYTIGIVLIIIGAVAIANSESNIGKMLSSVFVGLGIAACAVPIVRDHLHVNYTCA
ncbi:conjugal transfer protein TrbC [Burkholderia sp. Ac-20353]|uniref:conjugal transfer protein TrbC n=1 Tax=Burkholderia sp. Ac-20353 TaxID=2703894 RepID=UPI00197BB17D|nr:conjugal transfer protein TrbC [Burkholderia sp. Ac-20353]MBN3785655.1 conjugal transfer protein TrbC [Burkholderia sp. Ac-20353]